VSLADIDMQIIKLLQNLIPKHLPNIQDEIETANLKSAKEVAERAICLVMVTDIALGHDVEDLKNALKESQFFNYLSPEEIDLFNNNVTKTQKNNLAWRIEAAYALFWCLGCFKTLPKPLRETSLDDVYALTPGEASDWQAFCDNATLRNKQEIGSMLNKIYKADWACRHKKNTRLNSGVVKEWHYALSWVFYEQFDNWDDVSCDT